MEEKRKKILIIGEPMLDKTIFVKKIENNRRTFVTYKKEESTEFTFGGVFFISRYLQHFDNIDITVISVNPKFTREISEKFADFTDKFEDFTDKDNHFGMSDCISIKGSSDYIHSITRFMTEKKQTEKKQKEEIQQFYFQIEDYYVPYKKSTDEDNKRYTYTNAKKFKLLNEVKKEIEGWIDVNKEYDRRILLMDYDLGLFENDGLLNELKDYFNNLDDQVIIYSGKDYTKFLSFNKAHIVTYSKDISGRSIKPKEVFNNINESRSLILVSADQTDICVFNPTKKNGEMIDLINVPTEAWDCIEEKENKKPRAGHKAIITAHLTMVLTTDINSIINERSWINDAHYCSKEIAHKLLTTDFDKFDLKELLKEQNAHEILEARY